MERERKKGLSITSREYISMERRRKEFSNTAAIFTKEILRMMRLKGKVFSQQRRVVMRVIFIMGYSMVTGSLAGKMEASIEDII